MRIPRLTVIRTHVYIMYVWMYTVLAMSPNESKCVRVSENTCIKINIGSIEILPLNTVDYLLFWDSITIKINSTSTPK